MNKKFRHDDSEYNMDHSNKSKLLPKRKGKKFQEEFWNDPCWTDEDASVPSNDKHSGESK